MSSVVAAFVVEVVGSAVVVVAVTVVVVAVVAVDVVADVAVVIVAVAAVVVAIVAGVVAIYVRWTEGSVVHPYPHCSHGCRSHPRYIASPHPRWINFPGSMGGSHYHSENTYRHQRRRNPFSRHFVNSAAGRQRTSTYLQRRRNFFSSTLLTDVRHRSRAFRCFRPGTRSGDLRHRCDISVPCRARVDVAVLRASEPKRRTGSRDFSHRYTSGHRLVVERSNNSCRADDHLTSLHHHHLHQSVRVHAPTYLGKPNGCPLLDPPNPMVSVA